MRSAISERRTKIPSGTARRGQALDCLFLSGAVIFSSLPYVAGLGFYADDWSFLPILVQAKPNGLAALFRALFLWEPDMRYRPVQAIYLALGFKAFGLNPVPWHVVDTTVLALAIAAFYLALAEAFNRRGLAFVLALVFGLLPHYSSDRIWIITTAEFCALFAYLGLYALARSIRSNDGHAAPWLVAALLAMGLSFLSYEVEIGVMGVSAAIALYLLYRRARASGHSSRALAGVTGLSVALLAIAVLRARSQTEVTYHHHFFGRIWRLLGHTGSQAIQFNLWTYGLHMPVVLARLYLHSVFSVSAICVSVLLACAILVYLLRILTPSSLPTRMQRLWLLLCGFVVFVLGYGIFLPAIEIEFTSMGLENRVAIASAPGAACVLVAFAALLCNLIRPPMIRLRAYASVLALICGVNCLAVSGICQFWVKASRQQGEILQSVKANVHGLPPGSVVLLDGFCRYTGPGIVFEGFEAGGAIQLALGDFSLGGDVVSPNMHFAADSVRTTMYGVPIGSYPYGKGLFVYNVPQRRLIALPSKEAATAYLQAFNPTGDSGCPPAIEGQGARID
jgi:hypothetical protein